MAIDKLLISDLAAGHIYFVVWNAARQILDWGDHLFKAPGSVTTIALAATEDTNGGGASESAFYADLDLAYLNTTPALAGFWVDAMRRVGGSPSLAADLLLNTQQLKVAASRIFADGSIGDIVPGYQVHLSMNLASSEGDVVQCSAWVTFNGQPVTLGEDDTCEFDCLEHGTAISQFDGGTDPAAPALSGKFEAEVTDAEMHDDTDYFLQATIVLSGITLYGEKVFVAMG